MGFSKKEKGILRFALYNKVAELSVQYRNQEFTKLIIAYLDKNDRSNPCQSIPAYLESVFTYLNYPHLVLGVCKPLDQNELGEDLAFIRQQLILLCSYIDTLESLSLMSIAGYMQYINESMKLLRRGSSASDDESDDELGEPIPRNSATISKAAKKSKMSKKSKKKNKHKKKKNHDKEASEPLESSSSEILNRLDDCADVDNRSNPVVEKTDIVEQGKLLFHANESSSEAYQSNGLQPSV